MPQNNPPHRLKSSSKPAACNWKPAGSSSKRAVNNWKLPTLPKRRASRLLHPPRLFLTKRMDTNMNTNNVVSRSARNASSFSSFVLLLVLDFCGFRGRGTRRTTITIERNIGALLALIAVSGCATNFEPKPLPADHPASVQAQEAPRSGMKRLIAMDALTRITGGAARAVTKCRILISRAAGCHTT